MTTVDCDDPKNKDNYDCNIIPPLADIFIFPAIVCIITLGVWLLGCIIIALAWHKLRPQHRTIVLVIGILVCVLISPIGILLLQKYANWPLKEL